MEDSGTNGSEPRQSVTIDLTNSASSSLRCDSLSSLGAHPSQVDDDVESECVSEVGDIGDLALHSSRYSVSGSVNFLSAEDSKRDLGDYKNIPKLLEYGSCMTHLTFFGILGVLTRYLLLQKLFGPGVAGVTSDQTILYRDLPSNMVGSFLMGWCGVVFRADISYASEFLAIGLTTGLLGKP
ncbi:hypothetical protein M0R45_009468 [Rubus argutus]|uniref:Uncharacterized protein n=1 Tax=Rubus argutus TaxID=59490 RepID=A0AAW1Y3R0_RUBAR